MKALKKLITVLTLSTLGFAFTSNAALITDWDYNVDTAFTGFSPGAPDVTPENNNVVWGAPTKLSWGTSTGQGQSFLEVAGSNGNGNSSGIVDTNGAAAGTSTLTHQNFPITGSTLMNAVLESRLTLTPNTPPGGPLPDLDLMFQINFLETNNDGSCEVPSPVPCNDIFVIDPGGPFNQMFILDDYSYNVELLVSGLGPLSDEACSAVFLVPTTGCRGFTTVEGLVNTFDVSMRITASPIPEPSTILLLGLAMFGVVANTRSKRS